MRLTILGSRAGMPAGGEASSGYLVEADGTALLLDCGPGVATVLSGRRPAVTPDAVVVTHLHLDHCHDLLPLGKSWIAAALGAGAPAHEPTARVDLAPRPLYAPRGAGDVLRRWAGLFPVTTEPLLDRAFDDVAFAVHEYAPGTRTRVGTLDLTLVELRHAAPDCGVRIESAAGSLAYTGDTGPTPALVELARGVDLLLAECTLAAPDPGPHGHLCAADAGRAAAEAGVGELVLTHLGSAEPEWLHAAVSAAAAQFAGPVRIARPLSVIEVGEPAVIGTTP